MLLALGLLLGLPVFLLVGTVVMAGRDIIEAFRGGNIIGRLFGDLIHVFLFWAVCGIGWLWGLWMLVSHL